MKKVITFLMFMVVLTAMAGNKKNSFQPLNENGAYEKKVVVEVPGVSASDLYKRASEMLSNWKGSNGKSSSQIEGQDKETFTVEYKGRNWEGYEKYVLKFGWDCWSDFTLRIKCKDEKVQLIMTVASMTFKYNASNNNEEYTIPLPELIPKYKGPLTIWRNVKKYPPQLPQSMDAMLRVFADKIGKTPDNDEDF